MKTANNTAEEMRYTGELIRILDTETGEIVCTYTPGNPADAPALVKALTETKARLAGLMQTKRAIEQAFLSICPNGLRTPEYKVEVDINLGRDDAQRLVRQGFGQCVSLSESVKYRLLKTETKKLEKLDPERYEELVALLEGCTRTIRISDGPAAEEGEE